jgi:hypothetical protein
VPGEAIAEAFDSFEKNPHGAAPLSMAAASRQTIQESMRLVMLVRAYQVNGHFAATLDPLGLDTRPPHDELDPKSFGFTEADMDREFFLGTWAGVSGFLSEDRPVRTLREILTRLRETYSGNIGYEVGFGGGGLDRSRFCRLRFFAASRALRRPQAQPKKNPPKPTSTFPNPPPPSTTPNKSTTPNNNNSTCTSPTATAATGCASG